MKSASHLMVGLTALAALAAGGVLTSEERSPIVPEHAAVLLDVVDQLGSAWAPASAMEPRRGFANAVANTADLRQVERARSPARRSGSLAASAHP